MAGNAPFDTITGHTDWLMMNGYDPTSVDLFAPQPGPYPLTGELPGWFDITVTDPVEVRGGGEGPYVADLQEWLTIWQDTLTGSFYQDLANAQYTHYLWLTDSSVLTVSTWEEWGAPDIDLGVWYDANLNGIAELSEPYWTSATGGSSESVRIDNPWNGLWIVKVLGYLVTESPGYFSMEIWTGAQGYIMVTDYESPAGSGTHEFNVSYSVPAEEGIYIGFATFGFMGADDMFSIPFRIEVLDWGAPEIQDLSPAGGEAIPTNNLVVEFYVNDSVHPVYTGPDWGTLFVILDWVFPVEDLSWWTLTDDRVRLEFLIPIGEGYHELDIGIADMSGNWAYSSTWFTVNSQVDVLTAELADPGTGATIPDGSTVSLSVVTVRGQTEPLADVEVSTPTSTYATSANDTGYYELTNVSLTEGVNALTVTATNDAGVERSMNKLIVRDTICMLWVAPVASPTRDALIGLSGWTDAGATVTVDGVSATVNPDGTWAASASLSEGANSILIEATDAVGNVNQVWVDVELDTTPPSLVIASPADGSNTSEASVTVSGTTDAGATVTVNGVLASNGTTDWSATIVLSEGMNTITVTASDALGNSVTDGIVVEFIPPVYVTPEELAAALAVLEDTLSNLSDDMAALEAMLLDEIDALNASLLAEIADLQAQLDDLSADLADAVAALEDQLGDLNDDLLAEIADLQAQIDALQTSLNTLQQQLTTIGTDIDDLKDDLADLEDELSEDIGTVDQKADDTDAFVGMLMYLTLALFVIALALIGVVWFLMSRRMGGGSGGSGHSMEEVETHSEVEREFEALEKEIKQEEL
jgi:prefoldin subunit 5